MEKHTAWRNTYKGEVMYVEEINNSGKGDKYGYTGNVDKALRMTEKECRDFCRYMYDCGTVGFWS